MFPLGIWVLVPSVSRSRIRLPSPKSNNPRRRNTANIEVNPTAFRSVRIVNTLLAKATSRSTGDVSCIPPRLLSSLGSVLPQPPHACAARSGSQRWHQLGLAGVSFAVERVSVWGRWRREENRLSLETSSIPSAAEVKVGCLSAQTRSARGGVC